MNEFVAGLVQGIEEHRRALSGRRLAVKPATSVLVVVLRERRVDLACGLCLDGTVLGVVSRPWALEEKYLVPGGGLHVAL
jgi:hypothetical protein